jgi:hypothetical protein
MKPPKYMPKNISNTCSWQVCIDDYLDAELSESESAAFEAHLPSCVSCSKELALANDMILAFDAFEEVPCPDPVVAKIMQRVDAEMVAERHAHWQEWLMRVRAIFTPQTWARPALAMAAVALLAVTMFWMSHQPQTSGSSLAYKPKPNPQENLMPKTSTPKIEQTTPSSLAEVTPTEVSKHERNATRTTSNRSNKTSIKTLKNESVKHKENNTIDQEETYTPEQIQKAYENTKLAFALIGQAQEKATQMQEEILQTHVNEPIQDALRKPFEGFGKTN